MSLSASVLSASALSLQNFFYLIIVITSVSHVSYDAHTSYEHGYPHNDGKNNSDCYEYKLCAAEVSAVYVTGFTECPYTAHDNIDTRDGHEKEGQYPLAH